MQSGVIFFLLVSDVDVRVLVKPLKDYLHPIVTKCIFVVHYFKNLFFLLMEQNLNLIGKSENILHSRPGT